MRRALLLVALLCLALAACGGSRPKPSGAVALSRTPLAVKLDRAGITHRVGSIGSPPTVGDSIMTSNGTWTNSPTSFAYQWQDCAAGPTCTNIAGATAPGYVIHTADVGFMLRVSVTATNSLGSATQFSALTATVVAGSVPPSGGDGTTGTLVYQENAAVPRSPLVNTTGGRISGVQAGNFGQPPTYFNNLGKWFGNYYPGPGQTTVPPLGGVTNYADLDMNLPGACPTSTTKCVFEAVDHGGPHYLTNQLGQTTYHSMAFWVPATGWNPSSSGHYYEIQELHFANLLNGAPVRFTVYPDHVTMELDTGLCVSGSYCAYHSDADGHGGCPSGASFCLAGLYAIPVGQIISGAWNEIIVKVNWETSATGFIYNWYRAAGGSWHAGSSITGIPTTQYSASTPPPATWDDGPESYGVAVKTAAWQTDLAGYSDGTGFAAAVSALP